MTYSFQVICKDDEEMGTVLSALFGGLIVLGKEKKQLIEELEKMKHEKTSVGIDYDSVKYELDQLKKNSREKKPTSLEAAKNLLKTEGYVFYKYKKPEPQVFQQRRKRRTKKEMQSAGLVARGSGK